MFIFCIVCRNMNSSNLIPEEDLEEIVPIQNHEFTESELKALCLRPCVVDIRKNNLLVTIKEKAIEVNNRRAEPKRLSRKYAFREFKRKEALYCRFYAEKCNHSPKDPVKCKAEALKYLYCSSEASDSSSSDSSFETDSDSTVIEWEPIRYTQETENNNDLPPRPIYPEEDDDFHTDFLSAEQLPSQSPAPKAKIAVKTETESTEDMTGVSEQMFVSSSQELESQESNYGMFTGTLTNRLVASQLTSTQNTNEL